MSEIQERVTEVLEAHRLTTPVQCVCGWRETDLGASSHPAHVAAELAKAGIGDTSEAEHHKDVLFTRGEKWKARTERAEQYAEAVSDSNRANCDRAERAETALAEVERERDDLRATNDRLNRRAQVAEAAINELANGTGRGKAKPVAAEVWARCQETHERHCDRADRAEKRLADNQRAFIESRRSICADRDEHRERAERAEAALADLRSRVETLANELPGGLSSNGARKWLRALLDEQTGVTE